MTGASRTSSGAELEPVRRLRPRRSGARCARRRRSRSTESDVDALRGLNEPFELERGRRGLPAADAAVEPAVRGDARSARRHRDVPRAPARAGAVRDRDRRQRRGRQEHDRPAAAGAARSLARPSARRPRHHRRLPVPERGARSARADEPQGLPGELRRPRAAGVSSAALKAGEPEVRAPVYSHLTYDIVDGDENVLRSPDVVIVEGVNVLQTPAASRSNRREPRGVRLLRLLDLRRRERAGPRRLVRRPRLLLLRETSLHDPRSYFNFLTRSSEDETPSLRLGDLARDQPREPAREHRAEP